MSLHLIQIPIHFFVHVQQSTMIMHREVIHINVKFNLWGKIAEILPLVEFEIEEGITDMEAVRLIETPAEKSPIGEGEKWRQEISENQQTLQLDMDTEIEDPFTSRLMNFEVLMQLFG